MPTSVPVCAEEDGLYGLSWPEIFTMRDELAHTYYRKFRARVPLEELLSAGNLAITIARRDFPQSTSGAPFRMYLGCTMVHRFHGYWNRHGSKKVERNTCHGYPLTSIQSYVAYERGHDAHRLVAHLASLGTPRNRAMLYASLAGDSDTVIGQQYGLAQSNVSRAIKRLLQDLQAWAWQGEERPPPIRRRVVFLTPHEQATVQRLAQEGTTIHALQRRYGCDRTTIRKALRQGAAV